MADNQNSINYFGLQDWWGGLTDMDRTILDEVFKQKSRHGQSILSAPAERSIDVSFLSDLLIWVSKNPELQGKIIDKLMERYAHLPAPDQLDDDALIDLHHAQIRVMNYFYGQRNYASHALDMTLRIAQDNVNIEARVLRAKRERIKRGAYRKASALEKKAEEASSKGDLQEAAKLHLEAREKRIKGAHDSSAYSEEHPCFRQMAIIAEKNNDLLLAYRIALDARSAGWIDRNDDWTRRINRLAPKLGNSEDSGPFGGYFGAFNLSGFFKNEFTPDEQSRIIDELTAKHPLIDGTAEPDGHTARTALALLAETVTAVLGADNGAVVAHLDNMQKHLERYAGDTDGDAWERHLTFGRNSMICFAVVQGRAKIPWSWANGIDPMLLMQWYTTSALAFESAARSDFDANHSGNADTVPTHPARSAILFLTEALGNDGEIEPIAAESSDDGWAGPWDAVIARHRED